MRHKKILISQRDSKIVPVVLIFSRRVLGVSVQVIETPGISLSLEKKFTIVILL